MSTRDSRSWAGSLSASYGCGNVPSRFSNRLGCVRTLRRFQEPCCGLDRLWHCALRGNLPGHFLCGDTVAAGSPNMKTAIERLHEFVAALEVAALQSHGAEERDALGQARQMALALVARGEVNGVNVDTLGRLVSDSLPWTDDILKAWDRFGRARRKE